MEKQHYHKLIRDRIPQIITASGGSCKTQILDGESYLLALEKKLSEELAEYQQSGELEELADLLEVMMALVRAKGSTWQELENIRLEKRSKRGGFEEKLLLKSVTRDDLNV